MIMWLLDETDASSIAVSKPMPPLAPSQISTGSLGYGLCFTCDQNNLFVCIGGRHVRGEFEVSSMVGDEVRQM